MQLRANIATAFSLLTPGQRRRWALQLPFGMLASAVEALTVALVYALLAAIQDPFGFERLVPAPLRAWLPAAGEPASAGSVLALALGLLLLRLLLTYADLAYRTRVLARDQAVFAARLYRGYLSLPFATQLQRNVADHIHRLGESVASVYGIVLEEGATALRAAATMLATLVVLFAVQPAATAIVVAGGAMVLVLTSKSLQRVHRRLGRRQDDAGRTRHRVLHEGMDSAREIFILGRQRYFADRFRRAEEALTRIRFARSLLRETPRIVVETSVGTVIIVVAAAGLAGPVEGGSLLPALGLYLYAGLRILPGLARVLVSAGAIADATVPLRRLADDVAAMPPELAATPRWRLGRDLVLDGVSFSYGTGFALRDVSLAVARGEIVGLAGANGSGKSTLLYLAMGLVDPDRGTVRIDGRDVREDPEGWRRTIGYVPQSVRLLDESIRANILFGSAEPQDEGRLRAAIREAGLERDLLRFPTGLDHRAGHGGSGLSGGQRQRVALARALYEDSDVLVLDEVTTALDREARDAVAAIIASSRGRRTVLLATHDRDLLLLCDRVVYLEAGSVTGDGTPAELALRCAGLARILESPPGGVTPPVSAG